MTSVRGYRRRLSRIEGRRGGDGFEGFTIWRKSDWERHVATHPGALEPGPGRGFTGFRIIVCDHAHEPAGQ